MESFKKLGKMFLCIFLAVLILVGCSANKGSTEKTTSPTEDRLQSGSSSSDELPAEKVKIPEGVELTWLIRSGTSTACPEEEMIVVKELQKRTGINIKFIRFEGDYATQDEQYKMMIAAGNYPDLIMWTHQATYPGGIAKLAADGVAMELSDLIEKYMPNYKKILESKPSIRKEVSTDDGKFYFFSALNPLETESDKLRSANTGFVMRKDWLENVNLEVPKNIEEWYQVLTAFKNLDPNKNGQADEIPFDGTGLEMFAPAFGFRRTYYLDPETKKVKYGPIEPVYKEYLETLHKWYMEGLITDNSLTPNGKVTDTHITSDLAGSFKGLDNAWEKYLPTLKEKNPNADFVAVPWPATPDGRVYTDRTELITHTTKETTIITTNCKYPEVAATLIDYMYSDEGSFLLSWGIEGITFDYVDGKPKFKEFETQSVFANKQADSLFNYVRPHWSVPKYGYMEAQLQGYSPVRQQANKVWVKVSSDLVIPPSITFTEEENNKILDYSDEIGTYVSDMFIKFVTGEEPLSNFDTYVETLKKKNIDEIIQIYQNALDRYNAR